MKEIPLTRESVALVSDDDFDHLNQWKWFVFPNSQKTLYAGRHQRCDGKNTMILMHRLVMDAPKGSHVDHRNHETLDNQRENLRICSHRENNRFQVRGLRNTSGYKGVSWSNAEKRFRAMIKLENKHLFLGYFDDLKKAAKAYNVAAIQYYGEFACLNPL